MIKKAFRRTQDLFFLVACCMALKGLSDFGTALARTRRDKIDYNY